MILVEVNIMKRIEINMEKLKKLYEAGISGNECAKILAVNHTIIYDRLREMGITVRDQFRFTKGMKFSTEHKKKIANALTGLKRSEETKLKISKSNTGKVRREEVKLASSEFMKGRRLKEKNPMWQGGVSLKYNPVKERAHNQIRYLKRKGIIIKQPCEKCGKFPADAHHDNYTKPLEIRWLCPKHHREYHLIRRLENNKYILVENNVF